MMESTSTTTPAWRAERRATPWLANAIAGGAGLLVVIGVIGFGGDLYPDHGHGPGWGGLVLCALAAAIGLVLIDRLPTVLQSTGVAMVAVGIAAAVGFVQLPRVHGVTDLRLFFALTIVAWLAAFAAGPAKGRPLLLALALLMGLTWATVEVADVSSNSNFLFGMASPGRSSSVGNGFTVGPDGILTPDSSAPNGDFSFDQPREPNFGALGAVSVAFGVVYLVGVAVLDSRGQRGLATAAVIPGVVAMIDTVAFFGEKANNVVVAGLLSVAAGLFVGAVGAQSHRRFTVWIGAFGATVGALVLTFKITDSTTNSGNGSHAASVFGAFTILFGAAMVGVAVLAARALSEPAGGDDPLAAEAAPPQFESVPPSAF
jgi:hypothetical protein